MKLKQDLVTMVDSYSTNITDSSSSSHSSNSSTQRPYQTNQETNSRRPAKPAFRSALHSVRKFPAKNKITKKPIAPLPPTPPKTYKVDPIEFKDVVQRLTGAVEYLIQPTTRLQEVAPPPLSLSPPLEAAYVKGNEVEKPRKLFENSFGPLSPIGFSLSPSSLAWCSAMLLSPGTLASLDPTAIP